ADSRSSLRLENRCATSPMPIVSAPEPKSVPVTTTPTAAGVKPRRARYPASSTLTIPSIAPRSPRDSKSRVALLACGLEPSLVVPGDEDIGLGLLAFASILGLVSGLLAFVGNVTEL